LQLESIDPRWPEQPPQSLYYAKAGTPLVKCLPAMVLPIAVDYSLASWAVEGEMDSASAGSDPD